MLIKELIKGMCGVDMSSMNMSIKILV